MGASFKKLATASQDASADQVAAFEKLGMSMDEVSQMSPEELFTNVISRLQGMENGTERTAVATQLLGKGAMEMGALLNTSAEDTQAMIDKVHDLGGVMSEDAVKASAQFYPTPFLALCKSQLLFLSIVLITSKQIDSSKVSAIVANILRSR